MIIHIDVNIKRKLQKISKDLNKNKSKNKEQEVNQRLRAT